jgi:hypothetical protein
MDQGTIAFLSLFVICILFLERQRCKCADEKDTVEGHTSLLNKIPWWVLIAGIWVLSMVLVKLIIKPVDKFLGDISKSEGKKILLGPISLVIIVILLLVEVGGSAFAKGSVSVETQLTFTEMEYKPEEENIEVAVLGVNEPKT